PKLIVWIPAILLAVTFHEWAHGFVAHLFGDPTPKRAGRLTLNPWPHLDFTWSFLIPVILLVVSLSTTGQPFVFGGAKPVPINPSYFRASWRLPMFLIAIAGAGMNLLLALLAAFSLAGALHLPAFFGIPLQYFFLAFIQMNVFLAVFNLFPLLPLDGGRAIAALLPEGLGKLYGRLEPLGLPLLVLLMFSGVLGQVIHPVVNHLFRFYLGVIGGS
ncbi:MAG: site-2 protease family protein, partial [Magnetococcales bacterium]|nr:site-2 protease family protein [Magnetococcales bacterium]